MRYSVPHLEGISLKEHLREALNSYSFFSAKTTLWCSVWLSVQNVPLNKSTLENLLCKKNRLRLTLMKKLLTLEILVGLLTLIMTIVTMYPFGLFGIRNGGIILVFGIMISGITLLMVGGFRLANVFSQGTLSLAQKINVVTSVLVVATAVAILYFQITASGSSWLYFLFGAGLLSYSVGRVIIGAFTREHVLGLRAFNLAIDIAVGVLSIIVILFPLVLISSISGTQTYIPYGYLTRIALILIGVDYLVSAILGMFLRVQETQALDAKSVELPKHV